jgi:hypothetical protein
MEKIWVAFAERQQQEGMALAAQSDILDLTPLDGPPAQHYRARFKARGLVKNQDGRVVEADTFDVGIRIPEDYLRRAHSGEVLTYLGPHRRPWHPNIRPPFICMHLKPSTRLVDLLYACFDLWTWNLYGTADNGLNPAASQWARRQGPDRFPVERRPLKRRLPVPAGPSEGASQ